MSSTSRVLRGDEPSKVTQIWWRDTQAPATSAAERENPQITGERRAAERRPEVEREKIEREAYQRGFSEGNATGREQTKAELQPVLDRLGKTLGELSTLRSRIRRDAEKDLLKLSVMIARRVLHRELTLDPESIEGLIRVALEKMQSREVCRVRAHPDHQQAIKEALERYSNSHKVELIADPSLQCGDVLFETAHGTLDASIESQLREIERGFADRLQK
ncbi:MAG: FliH/SctL family protein [Bryobacteraceae bacterium]